MAEWREEQHPRRPDGRFRRKGGGWAQAVSDTVGERRGEHRPVRADSIADDLTAEDWARLASLIGPDRYEGPDQALGEIYQMQGFHARPEVVSDQELSRRIEQDGWVEMWRGFGAEVAGGVEHHEQFRDSEQHWPGIGVFGNGTYFSSSVREGVNYASGGLDSRDPDQPDLFPSLARAALRPDARVIDWDPDLKDLSAPYREGNYAAEQDGPRMDVMFDLGRAAALLGFDVIRAHRTRAGVSRYNYVVLNRSAIAIREPS
jgi:hypothetical protein